MKKPQSYVVSIMLSLLSTSLFASHGMGGEITWKCQGAQYIFEMRFYRDCNGIPGPTNPILETNVPGIPTIPLIQISITDISPQGDPNSGPMVCPVCPSFGSGGGQGAVHEYLYRSNPVTLPGAPPSSGWLFAWGECCRSNAITNLIGAGGLSMGLRAVMYPFTGFVAGQCNDNSPYFAEKPSVVACTGLPIEYNHFANDVEFDSLAYSWSFPVSSPPVTAQNFAQGYSIASQLPSQIQNSSNVPVTLNPATGSITFTSYNQGYFVTVVQVSSYRCGELTAEIFREINVVLISSCLIPVSGYPVNQPPVIPPPIQDTLGNMAYNTTVTAGDTVAFTLTANDNDPHPFSLLQEVELEANSLQFGTAFTDPNNGCLIPPCATLNPAPPVNAAGSVSTDFHWVTDAAHLGFSFNCVQFNNVYTFLFKAKDNYCPANGFIYKPVVVTVVPQIAPPPVYFVSGHLECPLSGPYRFQWFLNRWAITGADSSIHTPLQPGYYQVLAVDTVTGQGNYSNSFSYLVSAPDLFNSVFVDVKPNPSVDGIFHITINGIQLNDATVSVADMAGRLLFDQKVFCNGPSCSFPLQVNKADGIYMMSIQSAQGRAVKKIVVTRD